MACQSEAVHKQQGIVRGTSHKSSELESDTLEPVNSRRGDKIKSATQELSHLETQPQTGNNLQKARDHRNAPDVGKHHGTTDTKDAQCHKCQRSGHYSVCCYSRQISSVTENTEITFLGAIESGNSEKQWLTTIMLNKTRVTFKLDTGAEVTAISADT